MFGARRSGRSTSAFTARDGGLSAHVGLRDCAAAHGFHSRSRPGVNSKLSVNPKTPMGDDICFNYHWLN